MNCGFRYALVDFNFEPLSRGELSALYQHCLYAGNPGILRMASDYCEFTGSFLRPFALTVALRPRRESAIILAVMAAADCGTCRSSGYASAATQECRTW
jgi:hypothetical protein